MFTETLVGPRPGQALGRLDHAFLREVAAAPADDVPRPIYADWLEEHGGPADVARASFIRLQIAQARRAAKGQSAAELVSEAARLLSKHGAHWLGPLSHPGLFWQFHRGFVAALAHTGLFRCRPVTEHAPGLGPSGWLRFYPDGLVLAGRTEKATAVDVGGWMQRHHPFAARGRYSFCPVPGGVSVYFSVTSPSGTVTHAGTMSGPTLVLDTHCHSKGHRGRHVYHWVEVPDLDSRLD